MKKKLIIMFSLSKVQQASTKIFYIFEPIITTEVSYKTTNNFLKQDRLSKDVL